MLKTFIPVRIMTRYAKNVRAPIQSRRRTRRIIIEYVKIVRALTPNLTPVTPLILTALVLPAYEKKCVSICEIPFLSLNATVS
jgi:hypothetical protein